MRNGFYITIGLVALVMGVDIYLVLSPMPTISEVIFDLNTKFISPAFFAGVLIGHFFWGQKVKTL